MRWQSAAWGGGLLTADYCSYFPKRKYLMHNGPQTLASGFQNMSAALPFAFDAAPGGRFPAHFLRSDYAPARKISN